ncbi:amidohydrolase family protein [Shimia sp. SDUM112013]|uniref:amidohydrolase family protein n=1 Tax=Shimia sp. SDUM112013 TaxID=3136160 RepID=UPI0032ED5858
MKQSNRKILPDLKIPKRFLDPDTGFDGIEDGAFLRGDVITVDHHVIGMRPPKVQGAGQILMPRLIEAHCHLDKCHSVERLPDVGGNLVQAIAAQRADKINWSDDDIRTRAQRGLKEFAEAGTATIRSHVDWGEDAAAPRSWSVLLELAQEHGRPDLQLSALVGVEQMADPAYAAQVVAAIPDGHALGSFIFGQNQLEDGLRSIFKIAAERGLPLDFHVDEGLDPDLNGLEKIADIALETRFEGPILCGHAVSLSLRCAFGQKRIIEKLAEAGISVAMLPSTNLYLQGRNGGTPSSRGVTLAHELVRGGVSLVVGTDNVRDAFCPVGRHDPMYALQLAVLTAHLDPPLDQWLETITTNAAQAIGRPAPRLNGAPLDDLLLSDATDLSTLICGAPLRPATTVFEVQND